VDRRLTSLRNVLEAVGPGAAATSVAGVLAEEAVALLALVSKAEGYESAVARM
jgi:hypothetical protein